MCGNYTVIVESDVGTTMNSACKERGMEISESKTKTMHTTRGIEKRLNIA
jgi:hypothetical protein